MTSVTKKKICILPRLHGLGGMVSFQARLVTGLQAEGIEVVYDPDEPSMAAILVIGGTRRVAALMGARRRGVRIVQRLNGMNWLHRKVPTSLRHVLQSEMNNRLLAFIRRWLADKIVYQSQFSIDWWQSVFGVLKKPSDVVYNGVDLSRFNPEGSHNRPNDHFRILLVEGHLSKGYDLGLETAVGMVRILSGRISRPVELMVVGDVPADLRAEYEKAGVSVIWGGVVPREQVAEIDRSAHVLFSADLNAACPNSVIEALACGLPVISYATGALPEMVRGESGRVVPYGSDHWNLDPPDLSALADAAFEVLSNQEKFRPAARRQAEEMFGLEKMVQSYRQTLEI
jgi:glycosyltransferase involved in cell wall biosynthesis